MTEKSEDGGPAFPFIVRTPGGSIDPVSGEKVPLGQENHRIFTGMSLRDYFAGQALQAILIADGAQYFSKYDHHAQWAYEQADAMLKERSAK